MVEVIGSSPIEPTGTREKDKGKRKKAGIALNFEVK